MINLNLNKTLRFIINVEQILSLTEKLTNKNIRFQLDELAQLFADNYLKGVWGYITDKETLQITYYRLLDD